jgi:hypothetical protein
MSAVTAEPASPKRRKTPWKPSHSEPGVPCVFCRRPTCPTQDGRRRGLCRTCYKKPEVRALFPAHHSAHGNHHAHRLPVHPTRAVPGSEEKILVMMERLERGLQLHHPEDLRLYKPLCDEPDLYDLGD